MKTIWRLCIGLILPAMVISCFNPPEYPDTPQIEFNRIRFIETPKPEDFDTLALYIDFKDGDGDIGLSDADNQISSATAKYADRIYFDREGKGWVIGDLLQLQQSTRPEDVKFYNSLLKFSTRKKTPYDTLPDFSAYNKCIHWEIFYKKSGDKDIPVDTVYFKLNPNQYNIFIDFFISDGRNYNEYDFRKEFCTTFDGRIPILSKNISEQTPLQGTIRYTMASLGFKTIFSTKPVKLKIQIQDRKLNKSNIVETDPFTLQSIK